MSVTITPLENGTALEVAVTDKLHKADYKVFVPRIEKAVQEHDKIRLLFDMHDFHGWDTAALWEDLKFDARHFNHFERVAMVGEKRWEHAMASFCKPFTTGKVRYFDRNDKAEARQ